MLTSTGMIKPYESPKVFFTSDTHFHHTNVIKYCNRPFNSVEEMNTFLINSWNDVVSNEDFVYFLGDFGLGNYDKLTKVLVRLKGNIFFIRGNHDKLSYIKRWYEEKLIIGYDDEAIFNNYKISHVPGEDIHKDVIHGHVHGKWQKKGKMINAGVDVWNFRPVVYEELIGIW